MTTPKSLFSFPSGEDCYEINTADWVMVSCLNGRTTFQLKTKEFTIDGGKITKIGNALVYLNFEIKVYIEKWEVIIEMLVGDF